MALLLPKIARLNCRKRCTTFRIGAPGAAVLRIASRAGAAPRQVRAASPAQEQAGHARGACPLCRWDPPAHPPAECAALVARRRFTGTDQGGEAQGTARELAERDGGQGESRPLRGWVARRLR